MAAGCVGGIAVGSASKGDRTTTSAAVGPVETVTATATETVTKRAKAETSKPRETQPAEAETSKPRETQPAQAATIEEGTWTIGEDIAPGTYKTADAVTSMCYWGITRSGTNGSDIVENDIVEGGYPRVTLKVGQDFKSSGCGSWIKVG
ncbi:hypothetical protein [Microbispora bryophytorum]|uniref:hypothetical protein n=1 Tax=Microbispora bryophytorum TaxID=1460882 RepID=UPI0033C9E91F